MKAPSVRYHLLKWFGRRDETTPLLQWSGKDAESDEAASRSPNDEILSKSSLAKRNVHLECTEFEELMDYEVLEQRVNPWVKYTLFCGHFWLAALSLAVLTFSVWGLDQKYTVSVSQLSILAEDPLLLILILSSLVAGLSVAAATGALRELPRFLHCFTATLLALMCVEVLGVSVVLVLVLVGPMQAGLKAGLLHALLRYHEDTDTRFLLNELQGGLACCGVNSYQDWKVDLYYNCSSPGVQACGVPASCCLPRYRSIPNSQCGFGVLSLDPFSAAEQVHTAGCAARLLGWLEQHAVELAIAAVALLSAQALMLSLANKLCQQILMIRARWETAEDKLLSSVNQDTELSGRLTGRNLSR